MHVYFANANANVSWRVFPNVLELSAKHLVSSAKVCSPNLPTLQMVVESDLESQQSLLRKEQTSLHQKEVELASLQKQLQGLDNLNKELKVRVWLVNDTLKEYKGMHCLTNYSHFITEGSLQHTPVQFVTSLLPHLRLFSSCTFLTLFCRLWRGRHKLSMRLSLANFRRSSGSRNRNRQLLVRRWWQRSRQRFVSLQPFFLFLAQYCH